MDIDRQRRLALGCTRRASDPCSVSSGTRLDAHRLGSDGRLSPETSLVLIFEEEGQELT